MPTTKVQSPYPNTEELYISVYFCDLCGKRGKYEPVGLETKVGLDKTFCSESCLNQYTYREKHRWHCFVCGESLVGTYNTNSCSTECDDFSNTFLDRYRRPWCEYTLRVDSPCPSLPFQNALWDKRREERIERDCGRCAICGVTREEHKKKYGLDIHVHHKTPRRRFSNPEDAHALDNLITVCATCHYDIESTAQV